MEANQVIPEDAVEAAALSIQYAHPFQSLSTCRAEALAALEAAAPHMKNQITPKHQLTPKHQCEPWQIQANASGTFRYCAACGEPQP